jgi:hypothetical protein
VIGPFDIQRVPRGLQNLLNLFGPGTPPRLGQEVQPVLELLQYYGLQQRQQLVAQAAVASGGTVQANCPATSWSVLFTLAGSVVRTATITKMGLELYYLRGQGSGQLAQSIIDPGLGTAAATIANLTTAWSPGYPLLLPPGSALTANAYFAVDANATCTVVAEIGVFG